MTIALVIVEVLSSEYTLWPIFDRLLYCPHDYYDVQNFLATADTALCSHMATMESA